MRIFILSCFFAAVVAHAAPQPNIIVFLVDDMGWMDTSLPFGEQVKELNQRYHTPNMERLANEGMVFTDAYAHPVCTPSRVSLMTGINAAHHRVTNWTSVEKDTPSDGDNPDCPLRAPDWNMNGCSPVAGIPHTVHADVLPQLLADSGYFTIHVGKAHFAATGTPGASPLNMGFLVNVAGTAMGMPQSYFGEENYGNIPKQANHYAVQNMTEYYGTPTFLTEALTLEALKALDNPVRREQPFFLYMAHYAVHAPIHADPRFVQQYEESGLDQGQSAYASLIEGMDKSLGDLMDFLDARDIADETVILFMSDNGGNSISSQKGGQKHTHNAPLREGKGSAYEGGIREPMIVKWPGVTKAGTRTAQPVLIEDFFPTILEMAGLNDLDVRQEVDGRSFTSVLKDPEAVTHGRSLIWNYPHKWKKTDYKDIDFLSAIRRDDWKLVYRMVDGSLELYNLADDIGESQDASAQYPEKVAELASLMGTQLREWDAQMPIVKSTGEPVAWPDRVK